MDSWTSSKATRRIAMRIDILSAIPESMSSYISSSIMRIAQEKGSVEIVLHNLHDFALDRYKHIDDAPFGGGAGMLIKCQPVFDCIERLLSERKYDEIIYTSADGKRLDQSDANRMSLLENIMIIAGHYKGIDQRIRDTFVTMEISIGDFVLSGGELPALVITDSIVRLIPGVIGDAESALDDSFQNGLLEAPQYTRPAEFRGKSVPEVLLSGNHAEIRKWREEQSLLKTKQRRPDLLND